jgi:hypothetical protein
MRDGVRIRAPSKDKLIPELPIQAELWLVCSARNAPIATSFYLAIE